MSAGTLTTPRPLPEPVRRWRRRSAAVADIPPDLRALGLPEPLCRLLAGRGLVEATTARAFLKPRLDALHDPLLLADMDAAVARVRQAIERGEPILVHGDYDVDGIASAALLTRVLGALGARVTPFVPNRLRDGYDVGAAGLAAARQAGATLVVTADCGIVAHDAIGAMNDAGIDVVVTDHHRPGDTPPPALAVVTPNRPDCRYPDKGLCGAGVAYKLCQALWTAAGRDAEELAWQLDLVALATVADLVPLTGENRILVRYGLRVLRRSRNAGIRALVRVADLDPARVEAGHVSHVLAPRINAAGRIGEPMDAVRLLLAGDDVAADPLARRLESMNLERRELDRRTLDEAIELLERDFDAERDFAVVLAREGWHPGVIGIVASRVVERICRPAVLLALREDGGPARGSGRSIRGYDLHAGLKSCAHLLERFGGHRAAAGMDVRPESVDAFRAAFNEHARGVLGEDDLVGDLRVDMELALREATPALVRLMRHLKPFGVGNPTPVFAVRGAAAREVKKVGSDHLRFLLEQDGATLPAIAFRSAPRRAELETRDARFDVAFQLQEDEWQGRRRLQAKVVDFRPAR